MRALRLVLFASTAGALVAGAYACGSNDLQDGAVGDSGVVTGPDGATPDGTTPGNDAGGGGDADASAPNDANNAPDVPFDAKSTPDGGAASDPGHVACADAGSCAVPANECCIATNGGGSCKPSCPGNTAVALKCDEAANCDGGVCCGTVTLTNATSACAASCGLGQPQLCRTNGECPNHNCTPQTCTFGATSVKIEACGVQLGCTP